MSVASATARNGRPRPSRSSRANPPTAPAGVPVRRNAFWTCFAKVDRPAGKGKRRFPGILGNLRAHCPLVACERVTVQVNREWDANGAANSGGKKGSVVGRSRCRFAFIRVHRGFSPL